MHNDCSYVNGTFTPTQCTRSRNNNYGLLKIRLSSNEHQCLEACTPFVINYEKEKICWMKHG